MPATVPWSGGDRITVERFLTRTHTRAFVLLRRGRIVEEWYDARTDPRTRLASWSAAKSLVGLLAGQAIGEGRLHMKDRVGMCQIK